MRCSAKGKRPVGREHIHVLKAYKSCPKTNFMLSAPVDAFALLGPRSLLFQVP